MSLDRKEKCCLFSFKQLAALAQRFMENKNIEEASDLDGSNMATLGHAICGLGPDDIADLNLQEFS